METPPIRYYGNFKDSLANDIYKRIIEHTDDDSWTVFCQENRYYVLLRGETYNKGIFFGFAEDGLESLCERAAMIVEGPQMLDPETHTDPDPDWVSSEYNIEYHYFNKNGNIKRVTRKYLWKKNGQ